MGDDMSHRVYFINLEVLNSRFLLLLSILQPHLEPLLVVRSISYVSIKEVKEII